MPPSWLVVRTAKRGMRGCRGIGKIALKIKENEVNKTVDAMHVAIDAEKKRRLARKPSSGFRPRGMRSRRLQSQSATMSKLIGETIAK